MDINEIPDYMRALGYFPSDYEIECLNHELSLKGKRKIIFDDLVKLFINHSPCMNEIKNQANEIEKSLRFLCNSHASSSSEMSFVTKDVLHAILTDEGEKIDAKDAEFFIDKLFQGTTNEKLADEISISNLVQNLLNLNEGVIF
jgi:Ca2+-binding EF-hand superfamily protein